MFNPPYDERMKAFQIEGVYRRIGDALKRRWGGWTAYIFTGAGDAVASFGLRPSRKIVLFNGPIECRLLRYELRERAGAAGEGVRGQPAVSAAEPGAGVSRHAKTRSEEGAMPTALRGHAATDAESSPLESDLHDSVDPQQIEYDEFDDEIPAAAIAPSTGRRNWQDQAREFHNRLVRMAKHWKKWAKRQNITCFRLYDRDVPEIPLAIDWYEGRLQIAEYIRPHDRTDVEHKQWLQNMIRTAAESLEVPADKVALKHRQRQSGPSQYERTADERELLVVHEAGHQFLVNLSDYLDTGLFLDHRITRSMVERDASGKRLLNLFAYTGAFTVYATAGGATATTTVDLSNTYLDWARRNMKLNGFSQVWHQFVRSDALGFMHDLPRSREPMFDLAVVDPPTFSNSKMTANVWDVQRDYVELLNLVIERLSPGGKIYFSTNFRRFKFQPEELRGVTVREISRQTVPPDFRNKRIHRCWTIIKQAE